MGYKQHDNQIIDRFYHPWSTHHWTNPCCISSINERKELLIIGWCDLALTWMVYLQTPRVFHSLMVLSREPDTIWRLSEEKATLKMSILCPTNWRVVTPLGVNITPRNSWLKKYNSEVKDHCYNSEIFPKATPTLCKHIFPQFTIYGSSRILFRNENSCKWTPRNAFSGPKTFGVIFMYIWMCRILAYICHSNPTFP